MTTERAMAIAYNSIIFGKLEEAYDKEELMSELGCPEEEYDEIMNGNSNYEKSQREEFKDANEYGYGTYEISVKGLTTYTVKGARTLKEAFTEAINYFINDDLFYDTPEADEVSEKDCRIVDYESYDD